MPERKPLLIYHDKCCDGFGAAYSFWVAYGDTIDYMPLNHVVDKFKGLNPEILKDRKVWMVDIALERDDAIEAHKLSGDFTIIDHHVSAMEKLNDLDFCKFDMKRSGAMLAWNYCHPNEKPPVLIQCIQDRDLWTWNMHFSKTFLSALDSYEKNFETWSKINKRTETPDGFDSFLLEGESIERYNKTLIESLKKDQYRGKILEYEVPMVNIPFFKSELLSDLAEGELFSAAYHFDGEKFIFSLRSSKNGLDVSEIASRFQGGGGHKAAAGFSIKSLSELSQENKA